MYLVNRTERVKWAHYHLYSWQELKSLAAVRLSRNNEGEVGWDESCVSCSFLLDKNVWMFAKCRNRYNPHESQCQTSFQRLWLLSVWHSLNVNKSSCVTVSFSKLIYRLVPKMWPNYGTALQNILICSQVSGHLMIASVIFTLVPSTFFFF